MKTFPIAAIDRDAVADANLVADRPDMGWICGHGSDRFAR
jgi:hypothetical protein